MISDFIRGVRAGADTDASARFFIRWGVAVGILPCPIVVFFSETLPIFHKLC